MTKRLLILFISYFFVANTTAFSEKLNHCTSKIILGRVESIQLENTISLRAKIDTGADMSSLSAHHILVFDSKGKKWVRFSISVSAKGKDIVIITPLVGYISIKKRSDEEAAIDKAASKRPVVNLNIKFGGHRYIVKANLIDRSHFQYPLLLGVDAIKELNALVDVTQQQS